MEITYADVNWLAHGWELGDVWCLTFVRGIEEAEALRRFGAHEESIRPLSYRELTDEGLFPHTVLAGRLDGWAAIIERNGSEAMQVDVLRALSAQTELVIVLRHDHANDLFAYAVDGEVLTSFDPRKPGWRDGSDPDRLLDAMREVGFDPTHVPGNHLLHDESDENEESNIDRPAVDGALMLAARLTGVVLSQSVLNGPLLSGVVGSR
ncbi:hypothetical protein Sme01_66980 [Sphaerisporangium melleum]|uniref:Uncharacterized protein n=1 Tax=Sphaerisporangium melleum TaxID=321316 RepID=A0A917RGC0_9ACTN|nr:DUF6461 domain-containing protein [Sphaerisporangium melleum]GGL06706.1 hypothetical protein GCM10007964_56210 [Sphaerisporangium melleum]GII74222.1 hypothetical protein Sme01_66980 [Sphaerisporangium melleum]